MGNTRSRYLAALCAIYFIAGHAQAAKAQSATIKVEGLKPDQVLANAAARCAGQGNAVENLTDRQLVCVRAGGLLAQMIVGTRYGSPPVYRDRYMAFAVDDGTSLIVSTTLDTQNAFGGSASRPIGITGKDNILLDQIARGALPGLPFKAPQKPVTITPEVPVQLVR